MRIALGHKSRVGKNTFADVFLKQYNDVKILSFGNPLYQITDHIQHTLQVPYDDKPRVLLCEIASVCRSVYHDGIFADKVRREIEATPAHIPIVVTDLRDPVEYEMLEKVGFVFVSVIRPNVELTDPRTAPADHRLDGAHFDYTIINDASLKSYKKQCRFIIDDVNNRLN